MQQSTMPYNFIKRNPADPKPKQTRRRITLAVKIEILRRIEAGERQVSVSKDLDVPTATIRTIFKNSDIIKARAASLSSTASRHMTRVRSNILLKTESKLGQWIEDQTRRQIPLSQSLISEKAKSIFDELKSKSSEQSTMCNFTASKGWYDRYRKRMNIQNGQMVPDVPESLQKIVEQGNYPPQLVFNVSEINLFWKRMPSWSSEMYSIPNFKSSKKYISLMVGGNAAGDFRLNPMFICDTRNSSLHDMYPDKKLPIAMRNETNEQVLSQWFRTYFYPEFKKYCECNNLQEKALLVINRPMDEPQNLLSSNEIQVIYLPESPPNIVQALIFKFRAHYLRSVLESVSEHIMEGGNIQRFYEDYDITKAIDYINSTWIEVSDKCMREAWRKLWPSDIGEYYDDLRHDLISEITDLANRVGFDEVFNMDIEDLIQSHAEPPSLDDDEDTSKHESLEMLHDDHKMLQNDIKCIPKINMKLRNRNSDSSFVESPNDESASILFEPGRLLEMDLHMGSGKLSRKMEDLPGEVLEEALGKISDGLDMLMENDSDRRRSANIKRKVLKSVKLYRNMLLDKNRRNSERLNCSDQDYC